jgi:prevent-host-death family protein
MKTMETDELSANISEVLREVEEEGQVIEVTRQGHVVARLVPVQRPPITLKQYVKP